MIKITIGDNITTYHKAKSTHACAYILVGYHKKKGKVIKVGKFENSFSKRFKMPDYTEHYTDFSVKAIIEFDNTVSAMISENLNRINLAKQLEYIPTDRFKYKAGTYKFYYSERKFITVDL